MPCTNSAANKSHKKKEISYESLPQGTKNRFKRHILPLALDTTGALKPWNTPCDDTIIEIWNLVFGVDYPINGGDIECYRFIVAKTLVSPFFFIVLITCGHCSTWGSAAFTRSLTSTLQIKRAISSWIHKFADTAEKALVTEFTRQGIQTQGDRATYVQSLLGNAEDMSDKKRPFIWESAYDDPDARQEVRLQFGCGHPVVLTHRPSFQGIFQGRLVMRTFFEHLQVINVVDAEYRVQEKPIGALIYSIQAVRSQFVCSFCPNIWSGSPCAPLLRDWDPSTTYGQEKCRILKDQLG